MNWIEPISMRAPGPFAPLWFTPAGPSHISRGRVESPECRSVLASVGLMPTRACRAHCLRTGVDSRPDLAVATPGECSLRPARIGKRRLRPSPSRIRPVIAKAATDVAGVTASPRDRRSITLRRGLIGLGAIVGLASIVVPWDYGHSVLYLGLAASCVIAINIAAHTNRRAMPLPWGSSPLRWRCSSSATCSSTTTTSSGRSTGRSRRWLTACISPAIRS